MDTSNLTPDQQAQLAALLGQQNQQSIDPSQLGQQPTPSIGGSNGDDSNVAPEIHPATHLIGKAVMDQVMGRSGGANTSNLIGVRPQIPGAGLGSMLSNLFTGHPLMHAGDPVMGTTQPPDQSGLPSGMQLQPIGTDSNGKPIYDLASAQKQQGYETQLAAAMARANISNPTYTKDQLVAQGVPADDADRLSTLYPNGTPDKALKNYQSGQKIDVSQGMVDARNKMVGVMYQRMLAMYTGPGAVQKQMSDAATRLSNVERANAVYNTIANNNFEATNVTRNLLATEVTRVIAGSAGVVTDDAFNRTASDTAAQKIADWRQWLTNTATSAQYKSFAQQFKVLLDNEQMANTQLFQSGQKLSTQILQGNSAPMPAGFTPNQPSPQPGNPANGPGVPAPNPSNSTAPNASGLTVGGMIPGTKIKIKSIRLKKA